MRTQVRVSQWSTQRRRVWGRLEGYDTPQRWWKIRKFGEKIDSNSGKFGKVNRSKSLLGLRKRRYTVHGLNVRQVKFGQFLKEYKLRANLAGHPQSKWVNYTPGCSEHHWLIWLPGADWTCGTLLPVATLKNNYDTIDSILARYFLIFLIWLPIPPLPFYKQNFWYKRKFVACMIRN